MSEKAETIREVLQFAFEALVRTLKDLTQDEYTTKLTLASNNSISSIHKTHQRTF